MAFFAAGEDSQCSTGWLGKISLPPSSKPSAHKVSHPWCSCQATTFWSPCYINCTSSNLLDYVNTLGNNSSTVSCRKLEGAAYRAPDPTPLPKLRIQEATPFSVTGVVFTGPGFYVRSEIGITKSYICLFTCAVTRAVHLEVVSDLREKFSLSIPAILKPQISSTARNIR